MISSFVPLVSASETAIIETPNDFNSAELFYNTYGETAINSENNGAIIVVRDDGITDKYSYVFKDELSNEQNIGYTLNSSASYGYYDVYEISFNEKRDYRINMLFWNHEKDQQEVRGAELKFVYEYDETEGMKVSKTPSTNKQSEIFREKYGDSEAFNDKVILMADNVCKFSGEYESIPDIVAEHQVCANLDTVNMKAYGDDIIIPTGNPVINVYEFKLSEKNEYSLQILSGRENNIWAVYNYTFGINDNGDSYTLDSKQLKGDIDNNGTVGDLYDVIEIAKYIMGMTDLSETSLLLADYNADGVVDLYDAIEIAKTLMP